MLNCKGVFLIYIITYANLDTARALCLHLFCVFPQGIVRIHLLEAENLAAKDNYMKGVISGKSDPYAVLRVGTQTFTSHHVDNNLNPQWREMYEVRERDVFG